MFQAIFSMFLSYLRNVDKATLSGWVTAAIVRWIVPFAYAKFGFTFTAAQTSDLTAWIVGGALLLISLFFSVSDRAKLVTDPPAATKALIAKNKSLKK